MTDSIIPSNSTDAIAVGKENIMETEITKSNDITESSEAADAAAADATVVDVSLGANNNNNKRLFEDEHEEEEEEAPATVESAIATDLTKIDIHRPVKRARTAYFVFADERRAEVQKQVSTPDCVTFCLFALLVCHCSSWLQ